MHTSLVSQPNRDDGDDEIVDFDDLEFMISLLYAYLSSSSDVFQEKVLINQQAAQKR